jgi:DNA-binding CsgD family transcriptional regulator
MRVALHIADPALRARIVRACKQTNVESDGDIANADVVLADKPLKTSAPVIAFASRSYREPAGALAATSVPASAWPCDVRAELPADLDATTVGAVIAVVAAGLNVKPHHTDRGVGVSGIKTDARLAARAGDWAESDDADLIDGDAPIDRLPALTPREREVLALMAQGASNKAIARALSVSVHTAKFHVASVAEKLGASGRLEAVAIALRSGLVMI